MFFFEAENDTTDRLVIHIHHKHITTPQASFMCTTKRPELEQHASNKHPKDTFAKCFPMVQ